MELNIKIIGEHKIKSRQLKINNNKFNIISKTLERPIQLQLLEKIIIHKKFELDKNL